MLRSFCDICGQPASLHSVHLDNLSTTQGRQTAGLDVVLLIDGTQSDKHHICDECLANLTLDAFKSFENTKTVKELNQALLGLKHIATLKQESALKLEELKKKEADIKRQQSSWERQKGALEDQAAQDKEHIRLLTVQVEVLQAKHEKQIKQIVSNKKQMELDRAEAEAHR